jgi:hypothetical protein
MTHQHAGIRVPVIDKDIASKTVGIDEAIHDVGRRIPEGHIIAIGTDGLVSVARCFSGISIAGFGWIAESVADEPIFARRAIEEEHVLKGIGIVLSGNKIRGDAAIRNEASIGAYGWIDRNVVRCGR